MLTFPAPASWQGDALRDELRAAGLPEAAVWAAGDDVVVGGVSDADRAKVQQVLAAHAPAPTPAPVDHVAVLVAEVEKATTVAAVRAALVKGLGPAIRNR